jgi:hypothetical protein
LQGITVGSGAARLGSNVPTGNSDDYSRVTRKRTNVLFLCDVFWLKIFRIFVRLGRMNWQWEDFSPDRQTIIMGKCLVYLREGNSITLSALLNGFQAIQYHWMGNNSVKQALFDGIVRIYGHDQDIPESARQLANIIYYLGTAGMTWKDIRTDAQDSLLNGILLCRSSLTPQRLGNIISG